MEKNAGEHELARPQILVADDSAVNSKIAEFFLGALGCQLASKATTLRLDVEKLDQVLTLTCEIAVARERVTQMLEGAKSNRQEILEADRALSTA